jgi:hypothetical protein
MNKPFPPKIVLPRLFPEELFRLNPDSSGDRVQILKFLCQGLEGGHGMGVYYIWQAKRCLWSRPSRARG